MDIIEADYERVGDVKTAIEVFNLLAHQKRVKELGTSKREIETAHGADRAPCSPLID